MRKSDKCDGGTHLEDLLLEGLYGDLHAGGVRVRCVVGVVGRRREARASMRLARTREYASRSFSHYARSADAVRSGAGEGLSTGSLGAV